MLRRFRSTGNTIRHKQRLSVPLETEPAATTTPGIGADAVAIRHPKELRGGIAELQKRGLKIRSHILPLTIVESRTFLRLCGTDFGPK